MKNLFKLGLGLLLSAAALGFVACNGSDEPNDEPKKEVKISVDKINITADGAGTATFTVTYGTEDVTSSASIYDSANDTKLSGNTFATATAGSYSFYAVYNDTKSTNTVAVIATSNPVSADLVIRADKSVFTPNGNDQITFTVTYKGMDVTGEAQIYNVTSDETLSGNTFTTTSAKAFVFLANYDGNKSTSIAVTPVSFFRKVAMFRFTANWCGPCYSLSTVIDEAKKTYGDRMVQSLIHAQGSATYYPGAAIYNKLATAYGLGGSIPFVNFDLTKKETGNMALSKFTKILDELIAIPSVAGIKATSAVSGTTVNVDAEIWASEQAEYFVSAILSEDGIVGSQTGTSGNYTHNNMFRAISGSATGDSIGTLEADGKESLSFTFDLGAYKAENCHVMIFVTKIDENDKQVVVNSIDVPVSGGSVDYAFEN